MMRTVLSVLAASALASTTVWAQQHHRILEQLENSYELVLDDVTLPASTVGSIVFKECDTCERRSLQVNPATQYIVNDVEVAFVDLAGIANDIRSRGHAEDTGVYVHYDIKTSRVNRIYVYEFARAQ